MSTEKLNIFLTGASGYIGGSVLSSLLNHSNASNFHITALIRAGNDDRIDVLRSLNVNPIVGSNDSHDVIENAAKNSDVVIHTANSADDLPSTRSIISGLNQRTKETGKPVIYIHTSGTGVLAEDVTGQKGTDIVYDDLDPNQINSLPDEQPHREIDLFIINSAESNPLLKTVIVLPSLIYGNGSGPFNKVSVQLPLLCRVSINRKKAGMIGPGQATWNHVHIDDLADAFMIIFDQLVAAYGPNAVSDVKSSPYLTTGRQGYYFLENGIHSWRSLSEKVGEVLHKKGIAETAEVDSFPDDKVDDEIWGKYAKYLLGTQSNCKGERIRKLGWKPHRPSVFDFVEEQINFQINHFSQ